jgi:uncharacterized protein YhhL (DUF1145 family)
MVDMANHPFKKIFSNIGVVILRFPLSIICCLVAFIFFLMANHGVPIDQNADAYRSKLVRIGLEAVSGISLFYAFHIYSENKNLDLAKRVGLIILGLCVLGLHYYTIPPDFYNFSNNYTLRYLILLLVFHLLISFSLYFTAKDINAFWQYNEFLFVRFFTSVSFTLILFLGISGGLWSIDKLFGINISSKAYENLAAFMFLIFNTFFLFTSIPKDTHEFEVTKPFKNSLRIFIQYILLPIILIYALILVLYIGKIIFNNQTPKSVVTVSVLIFSIIGVLTYLLAYPIKKGSYFWINKFCQFFFYFMIPLMVLYFIAIIKGILNFGLTEDRYLALVFGIWLLGISLYIIISKKDNIIFFPISLVILLSLTSFGPWGMYKLSATMQYKRLYKRLASNGLIKDNRLITKGHKPISDSITNLIIEPFTYLYTHGEIDMLKGILLKKDINRLEAFKKEGFSEFNAGDFLGLRYNDSNNGVENDDNTTFSCIVEIDKFNQTPALITGYNKVMLINAIDYDLEQINYTAEEPSHYNAFIKNNKLYIANTIDTILNERLNKFTDHVVNNISTNLKDSTFLDNTINQITLPFRTIELNPEDLQYAEPGYKLQLNFIKCKQISNETRVVNLTGYAIF